MAETINYYRGPWRWVDGKDDVPHWAPPAGCVGAIDLRPLPAIAAGRSGGELAGVGLFAVRGVLPSEFDLLGSGAAHDCKPGIKIRDAVPRRRGFSLQGDDLLSMMRSLLMDGADPSGDTFAKPMIPGADGKLRFHLGPLCQHREKVSPLSLSYWSHVRDVIRHDFAQCFADAKAGRLKDHEQHRRVLDATCEKYGVADWRELVPSVLVDEIPGRLPHATTYSDDFNRTDGTGLGASWSNMAGSGFDIQSNQARGTNALIDFTHARYNSDLSSSDHYSQLSQVSLGDGGERPIGPIARCSTSADTCYAWTYRPTTNPRRRLFKYNAGTATQLSSDNTAPSLPETLKLECDGSDQRVYTGGVEVSGLAATDSSISSGLQCGMAGKQSVTVSQRSLQDDFTCEDLSAPPAGIIYTQLEKGIRGLNRGTYTIPGAG